MILAVAHCRDPRTKPHRLKSVLPTSRETRAGSDRFVA
jgi:hypothetical protein